LADLNGNTAEFRMSEDRAFLEAMNQKMASSLFYGTDKNEFVGLAPRFSEHSGLDDTQSAYNVIDGGGSGNTNTSIWVVCWSPQTVHGIYPKHSKAGFSHDDLGQVTLIDADGGKYEGYRSHYMWEMGLTVRDPRYVSRICNVDVSLLGGQSAADLVDLLIDATERIPTPEMGRTVIYCNRTIRTVLRKQMLQATNMNLTLDTVAGKKVVKFDEFPVRRCDRILNTEATVSSV